MLTTIIAAIGLTLLYADVDRMWGDDHSFKGEKAVILLLATAGSALGGFSLAQQPGALAGAATGLLWFAQRSLGYGLIGDSIDPQTWVSRIMTLVRHAAAVPLIGAVFYWCGLEQRPALINFGIYALAATVLASLYGLSNAKRARRGQLGDGGVNVVVELSRGAIFGAALAAALHVQA